MSEREIMRFKAAIRASALEDGVPAQVVLQNFWEKYRRQYSFAAELSFDDVCRAVEDLLDADVVSAKEIASHAENAEHAERSRR